MGAMSRTDRVVSIVLALAAVAIAVSVVYRTFVAGVERSGNQEASAPQRVDEGLWEEMTQLATPLAGEAQAPATLVEFTDLECPACRGFQSVLDELVRERGGDIRILYLPYPLPYHRFAIAAANAGECANELGQLPQWVGAAYAHQDSLGLKSWASIAAMAGIHDSMAIQECATRREPAARVRASLELGGRLGPIGTPTVVINGVRFLDPPSRGQLDSAVDAATKQMDAPSESVLLTGIVVDSVSGQPIPGATVELVNARGTVLAHSSSDAQGAFALQGPGDQYRLRAFKAGYTSFAGKLKPLSGALPVHMIILGPVNAGAVPSASAESL